MKAILRFDLNAQNFDKELFYKAIDAQAMSSVLWDLWHDILRPIDKHGVPQSIQDADAMFEHIKQKYFELLDHYQVRKYI